MAPTVFSTVAVAGGTGGLGSHVTRSLIAYGFRVRLLRREGSADPKSDAAFAEFEKQGATVAYVDYSKHDTLVAALAGIDVIVSVVSGVGTVQTQPPLLAAAKAAGVKRFVPSEWGVDYTNLDARVLAAAPPFRFKLSFREQVKESGLDYTIIENGLFMEYAYSTYYGFNAAAGTATLIGGPDARITLTTNRDIGAAVPYILDNPASKNAHAVINGSTTTVKEFLQAYEDVTGKKLAVSYTPIDEALKQLESTPADQVATRIVLGLRISLAQGTTAISTENAWLAGRPFTFTSLREYVAATFGGKA